VKAVAVSELKNRLSQYLREVVSGEVGLVTNRGKAVAELRRASTDIPLELDQSLELLASRGLLVLDLPTRSASVSENRGNSGAAQPDTAGR
jgi:prevent-host-death family protein